MGDLEKRVKLELEVHIQDEKTSAKVIYFIALALVIVLNLAAAYVLWPSH